MKFLSAFVIFFAATYGYADNQPITFPGDDLQIQKDFWAKYGSITVCTSAEGSKNISITLIDKISKIAPNPAKITISQPTEINSQLCVSVNQK